MVNVTAARTQFARLLARVENGEHLVIARRGKPVAKLVPYNPQGRRHFGALKGRISVDGRFFQPLPETELAAWETEPTRPQSSSSPRER